MKAKGLWVSPTEFVQFGEQNKALSEQLATRSRSIDFYGLGMYLPNPDTVLKKLGLDIKVYRELRSDSSVGAFIRRRKSAVKALEWGINRESAKSSASKLITSVFSNLKLERIINEMLDAVLFGYQPMEIVWGKVGSYIVPIDIIGKPAEWFVFSPENELRLRTKENRIEGEELPDRKFLLPRQDPSYDNPYGFPDLSMVFWPTTFKKGGLKFWVTFTEKYGMPWVVGKHPRGTPEPEIDRLLDSLENMVQDAAAVIPDDSSVEIKEAAGKAGSADVYERLLYFCRSEVSIALLGQNQTTESTSNKASATAGLEVTRDLRDGDKAIIEETLNQLIEWICDLNFGEGVARPTFSMWEQKEVNDVQATRDEKLSRAGAKFTPAYFKRAYDLQNGDLDETPVSDAPATAPADFAESVDEPDYADLASNTLAEEAQPHLDEWLGRIRQRLDQVDDLSQLQTSLLAEFSELDIGDMAKVMSLAFACADAAGRAEVKNGG
ncbi:DUF935 domain-containing protein [Iodobacter sp. BJB302]|uniref:DUF935 domain-containing protein n=1 Tax=Iodobacter sp. BJB302 TaxID=1506510 RepID=UPI000C0F5BF7|nr:DUF935 family protein [Iodobacter sp. BJB302]PHV02798.1 hypothetical protein CSQ88_05140 [Iodobacter sp. BJB302]